MIFELVAVIVAGFAGAGVVLALGAVLGRHRLPGWLTPLAAGAAMLTATIASEYSWYERTRAPLPEDMVVADTVSGGAWWRPWTYLVPMTERFIAVDTGTLRENADEAQLYMADLYFFGRWRPVQSVQVMVDCADGRRAEPFRGDGGQPVWRSVGMGDPIVSSVCGAV